MKPGDRLGRYQIERRLGRGGMAEVYEARALGPAGFNKKVAIKLPIADLGDPEQTALFVDEARLAAALSHRNIAAIYELGKADDRYYYAMELVDGVTLGELVRAAGPIPEPVALWICSEIAAGLHYAHTAVDDRGRRLNVVHRDVSPGNVLVSREADIKLSDFGIAKASQRSFRTQDGVLRGKLAYMSPEQANLREIGPASDQFSLGAMLFELLEGTRYYRADSDLALLDSVRAGEAAGAAALAARQGPIGETLRCMLAVDPAERFEDLARARTALLGLIESEHDDLRRDVVARVATAAPADAVEPIHMAETRPVDVGARSVATDPDATAALSETARLVSRRPFSVSAVLAAIVLGISLLAFGNLWRGGGAASRSPRPPPAEVTPDSPRIVLRLPLWKNDTDERDLDDLVHVGPAIIGARLQFGRLVRPRFDYFFEQRKLAVPPREAGELRLAGVIRREGDHLTVELSLSGPGRPTRTDRIKCEPEALPAALDSAIEEIAEQLGERLPTAPPPRRLSSARLRFTLLPVMRSTHAELSYRIRICRDLAMQDPDMADLLLWAGLFAWWSHLAAGDVLDEILNDAQAANASERVTSYLEVMRGFVVDGHEKWRERALALAEARPEDPFALLLGGEALVHSGDPEPGARMAWRALEIDPDLFVAEYHGFQLARMNGDEAMMTRVIELRRVVPNEREVKDLEIQRAISLHRYQEALDILGPVADLPINWKMEVAQIHGLMGNDSAAAEISAELLRQPVSTGHAAHFVAIAIANLRGPEEAARASAAITAASRNLLRPTSLDAPEELLRFATVAALMDSMIELGDGWAESAEATYHRIPRPREVDRRLYTVMQAAVAFQRRDEAALDEIARDPTLVSGPLAAGLARELRGDPAGALDDYARALARRVDGRLTSIVQWNRLRAARAAGDTDVAREACEEIEQPRVLSEFGIAAIPSCR